MKGKCKEQKKQNKKDKKGASRTVAIVKMWEQNDYVVHLNFFQGFLQLMCKASLIFKSNLKLSLWSTLI